MKANITKEFEKVYGSESDAVFRFCLNRVSNREQALDITQETFLRLWKTLQGGEELRNHKAFLFTIARRLIIDWYRKKKSLSLENMTTNEDGENYDVPDEKTNIDVSGGAEGRYLLDKIRELSLGFRQPVYLRFVEGLSPAEIADVLEISANAASVRITRGLAELRKMTGYDSDDGKEI